MNKDKFLARVAVDQLGCWRWQGHVADSGYGRLDIRTGGRRKTIRAHRHSYTLFVGEIPRGLHVLHRCDVRDCVNPEHLFLGTDKDNIHDCIAKVRFSQTRRDLLTEEQIADIKSSTDSHRVLAGRHKVSKTTIARVKHDCWRPVASALVEKGINQ